MYYIGTQANQFEDQKKPPKFLAYICMIYVTIMASNLVLAYKIIEIGSISIVGSTIVLPLWLMMGDIITEVYGYRLARRLIWMSIFCEFLFIFITNMLISLPSPDFWHHQADFAYVFGKLPKVFLGSVLGLLGGSYLNIFTISKWKALVKG